jgi:hypothetical protein
VINERYLQRRPILLATNKPLAALGDVVHDGDLAEAILDRLLERGVHFALRGRSYRTRHLTEEEQPSRRKSASPWSHRQNLPPYSLAVRRSSPGWDRGIPEVPTTHALTRATEFREKR